MSPPRHRPPPTAVRRAIEEGAKMHGRLIATDDDTPLEIYEEPSTPLGMTQIDRLEWRQQQHSADLREIGRAIGETRAEQTRTTTAVESLVRLAEKADEREDRREERTARQIEKREERETTTETLKRKSREKIMLAIVTAVVSILSAFAIGKSIGAPSETHGLEHRSGSADTK